MRHAAPVVTMGSPAPLWTLGGRLGIIPHGFGMQTALPTPTSSMPTHGSDERRNSRRRPGPGTLQTLKPLEWTLQPLLQKLQHLKSALQLLVLLQHLNWMGPDSHQACWHLHENPGERALPGIGCFLYWDT